MNQTIQKLLMDQPLSLLGLLPSLLEIMAGMFMLVSSCLGALE